MTDSDLAGQAISAALVQNWKEAIRLNTEILKSDKENVDALNRLGFAYLQDGDAAMAKQYFTKVLSLDRYNHIAEKNLKKLSLGKKKSSGNGLGSHLSPLTFLEDPGRTKIINCLNVAPEKTLSGMSNGQEVYLKLKKHGVEIRDDEDTYLGVLPDDISFKLIKFITGGNQYSAHIKSVGKNTLTVFLRETVRGKKFAQQPSFTPSAGYVTGVRYDANTSEKPDVSPTGEEENAAVDEAQ